MRLLRTALILVVSISGLAVAQAPEPIPLTKEPHHHLAFQNSYINLYRVEGTPADAVLLHRHDNPALSIMTADALITVKEGDTETHLTLPSGLLRYQPKGYSHSAKIDANSPPFHNITVELLKQQDNAHNQCSALIGTQPLNCPAGSAVSDANHAATPQFQTSEAEINLVQVHPGKSIHLGSASASQLVIVIDDASIGAAGASTASSAAKSGDFFWLDRGAPNRLLSNPGQKDARLIVVDFN